MAVFTVSAANKEKNLSLIKDLESNSHSLINGYGSVSNGNAIKVEN